MRSSAVSAGGAILLLLACDGDVSAREPRGSALRPPAASAKPDRQLVAISTYQGEVIFRNSAGCDESDCRRYSRIRSPLQRYALVKADENGGTRVFMIDTLLGEVRPLNGEPNFNPSRTAFITTSHDEMTGDQDSDGTFVWSIGEEGGLQLVRQFPLSRIAEPRVLGWDSDSCARLSGMRGWGTGHHSAGKAFAIRRVGRDWQLFEAPCN